MEKIREIILSLIILKKKISKSEVLLNFHLLIEGQVLGQCRYKLYGSICFK
jgi:hypothetical protein